MAEIKNVMYLVEVYYSEKRWNLWCTRDRYEWKES